MAYSFNFFRIFFSRGGLNLINYMEIPLQPQANEIENTLDNPDLPDTTNNSNNYENSAQVIPDRSEWHYSCCCECCGVLDENKRRFCCYWEVSPCFPILVSILVLFCYTTFLVAVFPRMPNLPVKIISFIEASFPLIMFFWVYLAAVCRDPGYLPFDWIKTKKSKYSWLDLMGGTATRKDQFDYVKNLDRPPGCSFSRSTGRYIIRADHYCSWISNWVGKRNHKQFVLLPFYGFFFSLSLLFWRFIPNSSLKTENLPLFYIELFATIIEGMNTIVLLMATFSFISEIMSNQTRIQKYKKEESKKVRKIQALKAIFGDGSKCCWICPTSAFPDDIELTQEEDKGFNPDTI
ncbi:DHHC zinc finger domain containing protein [Tritrichomonas foetus]|uniref:Palmitoyltransferase n=1 Tax=Tritrichomonas foetus TaxID=1144522 RepID=A0A1J4K7U8_9EUKA|nr:DHHC zinc finger domain containing protein [Tritrichomonas foetus]|eukprot:OHT05501.1 DHHC zinc finger domain containing protein [Tritrichomonas foetus]